MKWKKAHFNLYGIRARLGILLIFSTLISIIVFFVANTGLELLFSNYYEHPDFKRTHIQRQYENLQHFIDTNQISTQNLNQLKNWEKKQPVVLLELYTDDTCVYSSIYDVPVSSLLLNEITNARNTSTVRLTDQSVTAFLYSDFTYQYSVIKTAFSVIAALVLFILLFFYNSSYLIRYICQLNDEVQILEGGNLEYQVSEEGNDEITDLARSMNRMRTTLQQQIETEQTLHRANRQLITEMSHDLRTPLTGMMLYLEILRSHRYESEEQLQDYLEKIDVKAHYMKLLSDHLFEYAMQDSPERRFEPQSMESAFDSAVHNMQDDLKARGFSVEIELEWKNCFVQTDSEYIHRICENIISNIEKYAVKAADIRIDTVYTDRYCGFSVMNSFSVDKPQVDSNGIGIESIRSMMKQMNGVCNVEQTDVAYEITLLFPIQ